jgi:hypothetical protein
VRTAELTTAVRAHHALVSRGLYGTSLGSIVLCITLWIRAKTIGEDERGNAERRALFVGLWPPMFWLIGDTLARAPERERLRHRGVAKLPRRG